MANGSHDNRYQQLYQDMVTQAAALHKRNKQRIKVSLIIMLLLPFILAGIRWITDSDKMVFLVIWLIGMFALAAYMIGVAYMDDRISNTMTVPEGQGPDSMIDDEELSAIRASAKKRFDALSNTKKKKAKAKRGRIIEIILMDLRALTKNIVAIVMVIGLCVVPCLFAWFNVLSNWDPFEKDATSRIPIAVAVEDKGFETLGLNINVGDKFKEAVEGNDMIHWVICDTAGKAVKGVRSGDYYAALVVPKDFTKNIMSFSTGTLKRPQINYYVNEKKNAISPRITDTVSSTMQREIDAAFIQTLGKLASEGMTAAKNAGLDPKTVFSDLGESMRKLGSDIETSVVMLRAASGLSGASDDLLSASDKLLKDTGDTLKQSEDMLNSTEEKIPKKANKKPVATAVNKEADLLISDLDVLSNDLTKARQSMSSYNKFIDNKLSKRLKTLSRIKDSVDKMQAGLKDLGLKVLSDNFAHISARLGKISAKISGLKKATDSNWATTQSNIDDILKTMSNAEGKIKDIKNNIGKNIDTKVDNAVSNARQSVSEIRQSLSMIYDGLDSITGGLEKSENALGSLENGLNGTIDTLVSLRNGCVAIGSMFDTIAESGTLKDLNDLLKDESEVIAENLARPIKMEKKEIYHIEHFGSIMAPFYTVVGQWVGAMLAAVLLSLEVQRRRRKQEYALYQKFFGRYRLFMMVGLTQALLMSIGELLYVGIDCVHPLLFILAACVNGIVFSAIVYSLYYAFENVGLALSVILMLIQVAGGGGTFPMEVLPQIFNDMYAFMPFHYAMDAMRECVGGMYGSYYWKCLGALALFAIGAFIMGLVLYKPLSKPLELMSENKKDSDIML